MIDFDENVLHSVRGIRLEMGLTQEQFAAKLGVSFPTVNRWENHKTKPSPLALQKLQKLLIMLKKKSRIKQSSPENAKGVEDAS